VTLTSRTPSLAWRAARSVRVCVAAACPDLSQVSREFRGGSEGPTRRRPWFFGCPICCALCNKWVSGLQHDSAFGLQEDHRPRRSFFEKPDYFRRLLDSILGCRAIVLQGQQNEHLRKKGRVVPGSERPGSRDRFS
jgi:hypothetical protein